jgi:hypothetical protein
MGIILHPKFHSVMVTVFAFQKLIHNYESKSVVRQTFYRLSCFVEKNNIKNIRTILSTTFFPFLILFSVDTRLAFPEEIIIIILED